jgi:hypothetical protein
MDTTGNALLGRRRLVSSVVDHVGHSALHALGKDLLDLLGNNRVLAVVECVCLGCRLAGISAGGVDLVYVLVILCRDVTTHVSSW